MKWLIGVFFNWINIQWTIDSGGEKIIFNNVIIESEIFAIYACLFHNCLQVLNVIAHPLQ